jgi:hypothetical protein
MTGSMMTVGAPPPAVEPAPVMGPPADSGPEEARRRFTVAAIAAIVIATPPYLSVLWGGRFDPLRSYYADHSFANFFEVQARALFHGHWYVPSGSLGIEGFVVHGHEYTYFGPLPALLRMPLLAITSRFDGRLTAPSMLLAWLATGVCLALLLWRLRFLLRGAAPLGVGEATAYGAVIATVLSGSVLLYLGEMPAVYNEDLAWGVATTLAALFSLLGVLERPTRRRVWATGLFTLAATLSRTPLGWACVIGVVLTSCWFALGYGGRLNRQWWRSVLAAGLLPLLAGMYVTWAKFGLPIGLPMHSQVWAQLDQHRRDFLAANGGKAFSVKFLPTTLLAYFRPDGIRLTPVFPFVTLPPGPPRVLAGAVFDQTYRTASLTASMPLLFVLSVWGVIAAFRPLPNRRARLVRLPLLAAGAGTAGVLVWGYIANRYLTDFMPILCIAGGIGLVDLFCRAESRDSQTTERGRRPFRPGTGLVGAVVVLTVLGVTANVGLSSTPTEPVAWRGPRVQRYVRNQETISRHMGHPIAANVVRGATLPAWAPADELFVLDQCAALYLSDGERYHTWIPVDYGPGSRQAFDVTLHRSTAQVEGTPLVNIGQNLVSTVAIEQLGTQIRATLDDSLFKSTGAWVGLQPGRTYRVTVDSDTQLHTVSVSIAGQTVIDTLLATGEQRVVTDTTAKSTEAITLASGPVPEPGLCRNLS